MAQDGETEVVTINEEVIDQQTGENVLVNDLSMGKYGVVAESGPAFATQRQESAQQILDLMAASPTFESLGMDLVVKDLPILESKEFTKRVRKLMIGQGTVEPTEQEIEDLGLNEPQPADPQQEAVTTNINMQTAKIQSEIESNDAKTLQVTIDTQNSTIKAYQDLIEAFKKQAETGISFTQADHNIRVKQQDIISEAQQAVDEGANSEQAASIVQDAVAQEQQAEASGATEVLTVRQPSASVGQDDLNG